MSPTLDVQADLELEVGLPGREPVRAHLTGAGTTLLLAVGDPGALTGRGNVPAVRALASGLADHGLVVRVVSGERHLVTLGAVRTPWWQRRLTRSGHIRLGDAKGLLRTARSLARGAGDTVLPDHRLAPPPTVLPLVPTLRRRPRRVTTTHATGGGVPRLVLSARAGSGAGLAADDRRASYRLRPGVTTIGSGQDCDIRLPGLADLHAEVHHDDADEFVLVARDPDTRVNGERSRTSLLRTASRVDVGRWTLTYYREEYADHGRPYGGRIGGELGRQRPQPPRPHLTPRQPEDQ